MYLQDSWLGEEAKEWSLAICLSLQALACWLIDAGTLASVPWLWLACFSPTLLFDGIMALGILGESFIKSCQDMRKFWVFLLPLPAMAAYVRAWVGAYWIAVIANASFMFWAACFCPCQPAFVVAVSVCIRLAYTYWVPAWWLYAVVPNGDFRQSTSAWVVTLMRWLLFLTFVASVNNVLRKLVSLRVSQDMRSNSLRRRTWWCNVWFYRSADAYRMVSWDVLCTNVVLNFLVFMNVAEFGWKHAH
jgi:hypothetical protein